MALETGTYISDLVTSNPPQSDSLTQAAGHLRLLKSVIQATFPNIDGAVTATQAELNGAGAAYTNNQFVPSGVMCPYGGTSAPTGWLLCYGQSLLRADYSALFSAIGTTFGAADGTHFSLPDCRDRFIIGKADMGGSDAGIIDSLLTSTTLGATYDGEGAIDTITLSASNIPSHTHSISGSVSGTTGSGGSHSHTVSGTTSSDGSHSHSYDKVSNSSTANAGPDRNVFTSTSSTSTSSSGTHSHTWSGTTSTHSGHTHTFSGSFSGTSGATGSGTAFTVAILPPSIVLNIIIKT